MRVEAWKLMPLVRTQHTTARHRRPTTATARVLLDGQPILAESGVAACIHASVVLGAIETVNPELGRIGDAMSLPM